MELTFYFCYIMILSEIVMPRISLWDHELHRKFIRVFFSYIPILMHVVIYGVMLAGIYKTIKRFQGNSMEEGAEEQ